MFPVINNGYKLTLLGFILSIYFFHLSILLLCVLSAQDALASFDFLNKRNSIALKPDLDRVAEQELQHPDLELTAIQKDAEIRWEESHMVTFQVRLKEKSR